MMFIVITNISDASKTAYYVSINGTDTGGTSGDINNPFQTLNYAISRITNQDTIYFREGSYEFNEQEISTNGLSLQGYKDEKVTFDGTRPISDLRDTSVNGGNWQTHTIDIVTDTNQTLSSKTIYKIKLNSDVEIWQQLFYNRDEVINAQDTQVFNGLMKVYMIGIIGVMDIMILIIVEIF